MSNNHTNHIRIYKAFHLEEESQVSKSRALAIYLIEHIKIRTIPAGTNLPSVKELRGFTSLSYKNINEAFQIMQALGYLIIISGRLSTVTLPSTEGDTSADQFNANFHIKQPRLHMLQFEKRYQKLKLEHSRAIPPVMENSISYALIETLATRVNFCDNLYNKSDQFYYTHDYQLLIKAIGLVIKEDPGTVVISSQNDSSLRKGLDAAGLQVLEIDGDEDGFCVNKLAEICSKQKVAAVFISSKASFPRFTNTTSARIEALFLLQKTYEFKIVENDGYAPWLAERNNFLLELAGTALNDVIYLYPITYLLQEVSQIRVVAAQALVIARITEKIRAEGGQNFRATADATNELLLDKKFPEVQDRVRYEVLSLRSIIWEVFGVSGFWDINNVKDSGPGIFLTPKIGTFPADAFHLLADLGYNVYDPDDYNGSALDGLRIDLSYYISKKNFKIDLQKLETHCREICLLGRGNGSR